VFKEAEDELRVGVEGRCVGCKSWGGVLDVAGLWEPGKQAEMVLSVRRTGFFKY